MTNPSRQDRSVIPTGTVDLAVARISVRRLEDEYAVHKQACDRLAARIAEEKKKWDEEQEIERDPYDPAWEGWLEYPPQEGYTTLSSSDEINSPEPEETESEVSGNEGYEISCPDWGNEISSPDADSEFEVSESEDSDDEIYHTGTRCRVLKPDTFRGLGIEDSDDESDDDISLVEHQLERGDIFGIDDVDSRSDFPIIHFFFPFPEEDFPISEVEEIFVSDDEELVPESEERADRTPFEPPQTVQQPEMTPQAFH